MVTIEIAAPQSITGECTLCVVRHMDPLRGGH
jgi:hypothetical protein